MEYKIGDRILFDDGCVGEVVNVKMNLNIIGLEVLQLRVRHSCDYYWINADTDSIIGLDNAYYRNKKIDKILNK